MALLSRHKEYVELLKLCSNKIETTVIYTDNRTAESIKLASNSYLAMRVSFFNEIDCLAMEAALDTKKLNSRCFGRSRIGSNYNNPSFAYGGYCLPKDVKQLNSIVKCWLKISFDILNY